ncbi:anion transporter [Methanoregula sp.]|uniref:anion transporter n=1 Tax=Methanoregula sp. TaxID=2052170 RepID=UPI003C7198C2
MGRFHLKIWQIMLGGALAVLLTGQIAPADAFHAVDADVMIFLFGMFVVGEALVSGGYLSCIAHRFFAGVKNPDRLVLCILFGAGILSALLMNDTLAVIGTPLVLALAAGRRISKKLLLLTLAFAITTGSVMSPIGNPQNLLIALHSGMASPFITFAVYLAVPTLACLGITYGVLRWTCRDDFQPRGWEEQPAPACDARKMIPAQVALAVILVLTLANVVASLVTVTMPVSLPLIAIGAALPVLILSEDRTAILRSIDWCTLVFFAAMFVLMASVWQTGFFQSMATDGMFTSVPALLGTSVVISQFISNVPFVALFQPLVQQAGSGTARLMALAAGSTIAGNLTILGAASNVIIIQNAEKQGETLTFFEFLKVGLPLTIIQIVIFAGWLAVVG